jgi:hypothetical protein
MLETEKAEALLASVAMTEKVKVQAKDLQQLSTLVDENNKLQQQLSDVETKTRGIYLYHIFNVWMVFEN